MPETDLKGIQSALFANLVLQQTNAALVFLGQVPDPETGKSTVDLDKAGLFIDTLEMLAARTTGNLDPREQEFLNQNLTTLRLLFVEAADKAPASSAEAASASEPPGGPGSAGAAVPGSTPPADANAAADARKKFVKKY